MRTVILIGLLSTPALAVPDFHYVVAKNGTKTTAPIISYEALQGGLWRELGRVPVGHPCEPGMIRHAKYKYYVVDFGGRRGLAHCEVKK